MELLFLELLDLLESDPAFSEEIHAKLEALRVKTEETL